MMLAMRTTITLDPDVEQLLKKVIKERDVTFKQAVNEAIRTGLKGKALRKKRFRQRTFSLGAKPGFPGDKALAYAFELEDQAMLRKMEMDR
jgi:hypothetical protein